MGILNVTPDSFSDGGVHLQPDAAEAAARRMIDEGAAIVDVGGESTRPGSEGVSRSTRSCRRVVPVLERLSEHPGLDRHGEGRGGAAGARARGGARERRHGAARRSGAGRSRRRRGGLPLPDAHARRAEDDAAGPALRRRGRRRSRRSSRSGSRRRSRPASPRSGSASTPASASARRPSRTSSSCVGWTCVTALGRPVVVGFSRKSSLGKILGDPEARTGTAAASVGAALAAFERGASIFRVHDVREHVEALAVAGAVSA